jgi:aminopeptidase N
VKPINYAISIFDIEMGGAFSYQGTVRIEIDIRKSVKDIVLNAHELKIKSAKVQTPSSKGRP